MAVPQASLILVVDDDQPTAEVVGDVLTEEGFQVQLSNQGRSCYPLARDQQPALIILDCKLPDVQCLDVITQLKSDEQTSIIPVLLYSASPAELDLARNGFPDEHIEFLHKPFDLDQLLEAVQKLTNI
jgi:CheY-like chemotaxis protein